MCVLGERGAQLRWHLSFADGRPTHAERIFHGRYGLQRTIEAELSAREIDYSLVKAYLPGDGSAEGACRSEQVQIDRAARKHRQ